MSKVIITRLADYDRIFQNTLGARIINDSRLTSNQVIGDYITNLFYKTDTDIGFVASCSCGHFSGRYFAGHVCPYCGSIVSTQFATSLNNVNWIGIPSCMGKVIHPVFYAVMKEWLGKAKYKKQDKEAKLKGKKISLIEAILNPAEQLPYDVRSGIKGQGFSYFVAHADEIMDFLLNKYKATKINKSTPFVRKMYEKYKDIFLVDKLPILHPSMHPLAKEGKMKAVDVSAQLILPAIVDLHTSSFSVERCVTSPKYADRALWKVYNKYIQYQEIIITKKLGDKYAHIRRHVIGARVHFSARSVIVPITTRHMADEVHLPWKMAVNGLRHEILNVLMNRRGYDYNRALSKFMKSLVVYDQDIYDIMMTLMKECSAVSPTGRHGFPILLGRNPAKCLKLLYFSCHQEINISIRTIPAGAQVVTSVMRTSLNCWKILKLAYHNVTMKYT
jgi:hypothetical protein